MCHHIPQATYPNPMWATYYSIIKIECGFLFGLAPSGVYLAVRCCHRRGALLPHPFTLTGLIVLVIKLRRYTLCCTFRRLSPPRRYLALCPVEPGLSSIELVYSDCLANSRRQAYGFITQQARFSTFFLSSGDALMKHVF